MSEDGVGLIEPSSLTPEHRCTSDLSYALIYEGESEARARSGEPLLVLLPGAPSDERDFRHLAPYCARWTPVVRLLWPGFKRGPDEIDPEEAPANTVERSHYLRRVADAEGWRDCIAVGHSMGGIAALAWAVSDERVIGLELLASVGVKRHRGMIMGARAARVAYTLTHTPLLGRALCRLFDYLMHRMGFKRYRFDPPLTRLILRYVIGLNFKESRTLIKRLTTRPTLKVAITMSTDDPIVNFEAGRALVQAVKHARPDAEVSWLERGGHNPQRNLTFEIDRALRARYSISHNSVPNEP